MPLLLDPRAGPDGAGDPAPGARREGARRGCPLSRDPDAVGPGPTPDAAPDAPGREAGPDAPSGAPDREAGGVLVIGYGNTLRSDDGVGVHAAALLRADPRLAGAEVLALHQLAPELALDMSRASLVILVDASTKGPPGSVAVRRLTPDSRRRGGADPGVASHHVGAEELLELAAELYGAAPEVVVVSVGVATMATGEELSPAVAAALPEVAQTVAALLAGRLGPAG